MKLLPLTKGLFAKVDDEDFEKLSKYHWYADCIKGRWYAKRRGKKADKRQSSIYLHRELMCITDRTVFIDHQNNDSLDNQKHNLRLCNNAQNLRNAKKRKDSSQLYKGVEIRRNGKSWSARIAVDGKRISIGTFGCPIIAAKAYDSAAIIYHKEFACLNFPNDHQ